MPDVTHVPLPVKSDPFLVVSLFLPFVVAVIACFVCMRWSRAGAFMASASYIPMLVYTLYALANNYRHLVYLSELPPPIGKIYLVSDGISNSTAIPIVLIGICLSISSYVYAEHRFEVLRISRQFHVWYLLYTLCCASFLLLIYSYNLLFMYIGSEVGLIASGLAIALYGYDAYGKTRGWVALLYIAYGIVSAIFFLAGFAVIAIENGTLDLTAIKYISLLAWILCLIGGIVKLPTLGPHVWIPWAHGLHPTPVAALVICVVGLGAYILARMYMVSPWFFDAYALPIALYAVIGGIIIGLGTVRHEYYKWLLAYSTSAHSCYLLLGLTLGPYGIAGLVLHFISHALGKATLFMSAANIIVYYERQLIREMGGLQTYIPLTGGVAVLGWLALTGIGTITLVAKILMFIGLVYVFLPKYGLTTTVVVAILMAIMFMISGFYAFWTLKEVFYGQPRASYEKVRENYMLVVPELVMGSVPIILLIPPISTMLVWNILDSIRAVMAYV